MSGIIEIAFNILLPIILVAAIGAYYSRVSNFDRRMLADLLFFVFIPFFVIDGLANLSISTGVLLEMIAFVVVLMLLTMVIAFGVAWLLRLPPQSRSAFVLASVVMNSANYGIPVNEFAFGATGAELALVYYLGSALFTNTLGVFIASSGTVSPLKSVQAVFTAPLFGATVIGLIIGLGEITLPTPVTRATGILAEGTIPVMLLLLGMQLVTIQLRGDLRPIVIGAGLKLMVAAGIAVVLAAAFGLEDTTRNVAIVESAMPTAVFVVVLTERYRNDVALSTGIILVSTVGSLITLSVLLSVLQ